MKIFRKKSSNKNYYIFYTFLNVMVLFLVLFNISKLNGIVSRDEFGYWSSAANFAGLDWSNVSSQLSYFSYGCGLVWFGFIKLGFPPEITYKMVIVLNAVLVMLSFNMAFLCSKKLFKSVNHTWLLVFSFVVTLYPSNLTFAKIGLSETFITITFWISIYLLIRIMETRRLRYYLLFNCVLGYFYMVHMRNIGIIISGILVVILVSLRKNMRACIGGILILAVVFVLAALLKDYTKDTVFSKSILVEYNDFSSRLGTAQLLFQENGFINLIKSFLGKVFYISLSSLTLALIGTEVMVRRSLVWLRNIFWRKGNVNCYDTVCFFTFLSLGSTLTIVAISTIIPSRVDHIMIGRYLDSIIGPVLLIGLIYLYKSDKAYIVKTFLVNAVIICGLALAIEPYCTSMLENTTQFEAFSCVGLASFFKDNIYLKDTLYICTLIVFILSGLLYLAFYFKEKKYRITMCAGLLLLAGFWVFQMNTADKVFTYKRQAETIVHLDPIEDVIAGENNIYFVPDNEYVERLQFKFPEKHFKAIAMQDVLDGKLETGSYIICFKYQNEKGQLNQKYELVSQGDLLQLFFYEK